MSTALIALLLLSATISVVLGDSDRCGGRCRFSQHCAENCKQVGGCQHTCAPNPSCQKAINDASPCPRGQYCRFYTGRRNYFIPDSVPTCFRYPPLPNNGVCGPKGECPIGYACDWGWGHCMELRKVGHPERTWSD